MLKLVTKKKDGAKEAERRLARQKQDKTKLFEELEERMEMADTFSRVSIATGKFFFLRFARLYQTLEKGVDDYYFKEFAMKKETPITKVVILNNLKLLQWMFKDQDRFDVNMVNSANKTPLELAVQKFNREMIHILLRHGAHVTIECVKCAVRAQHVPLLTLLLRRDAHNASVYSCNLMTYTTLCMMALETQNANILGVFFREVNCSQLLMWLMKHRGYIREDPPIIEEKILSDQCRRLRTSLAEKIDGRPKLMQILVNLGVDVNAKDAFNQSALWFASTEKEAEILLAAGADINFTLENCTLVGRSVRMRNAEMVRFWISRGVGTECVVDQENNTPLLYCAKEKCRCGIPEILLAAGADMEAKNSKNQTPLLASLCAGDLYLAHRLLEAGASVNVADQQGMTPLFTAAQMFIPKAGVDGENLIRKLVEKGAGVNWAGKKSEKSVLMFVAEHCSIQLLKLFIDAGADIEARDANRKSVLAYAAKGAKKELIRKLLAQKKLQREAEEAAAHAQKVAKQAEEAAAAAQKAYEKITEQPRKKKKTN